jgi:hypothetical protein
MRSHQRVFPATIKDTAKPRFSPCCSAGKIICTNHHMVELGGKGWACAAGLCHAVISDLMGLNLIVNETRRFCVYSYRQ